MLCLAAGEEKVHALTMGARGADEFMEVMCDIQEDEEPGIDGIPRTMRVFRGLQNVNLLRSMLHTVATIKTAKDVGGTIHVPEAPENQVRVQLPSEVRSKLDLYLLAYQGAREMTKTYGAPTDEQAAAVEKVAGIFGEPVSLIAHPFNLINKMSLVIADPEMDERATFYTIAATEHDKAEKVIAQFNKLKRIEVRRTAGPHTAAAAIVGKKVVKEGEAEATMLRCQVEARLLGDGRIVVDTLDHLIQSDFERLATDADLDLDCTIPPKLAALVENANTEEAHSRNPTGRTKQLVFCDILPLHNKIRRVLSKHAGIPANQIAIVSGKTIKSADQIQDVQDGFNAEGEGARFRTVVANEKAEVGIDLQIGTQAIHHLTIGWTPDATTQRNGRGARQGNMVEFVNVYFYDADGTFDQYKRNLTSKKGDWIDQVMSPEGGNEVAVSGGLTNEQYDELIQSMGDADAMEAAQQRAELRERQARAASARARQVVNLQTAAAQQQFISAYRKADDWLVGKVMALYDLRLSLRSMQSRADGGKMKADAMVKLLARIAEIEARVASMIKDIDSSIKLESSGYMSGWRTGGSIVTLLDTKSNYSIPSKVREEAQTRTRAYAKVVEGSDLDMEWQQEITSAEKMHDEALKDFARLSTQDGTLPGQLVAAHRDGQAAVFNGQVLARGMFVRLKDGRLCVMDSPTRIVRYPRGEMIGVQDAMTAGAEFIMFGTDAYEAAVSEAAAFDDSVESVTIANMAYLFGSVVPDVAMRRSKPVQVTASRGDITLNSGPFRYPINTTVDGLSQSLLALAARQVGVLGFRAGDTVLMDAASDYRHLPRGYDGAATKGQIVSELVDVAKAEATPFTVLDYAVAAFGESGRDKFWLGEAKRALIEQGDWPEYDYRKNVFDEAGTVDAAEELAARMMRDVLTSFLVLPEGAAFEDWASYSIRQDLARRVQAIQRADELKQIQEQMALSKPVAAPSEEEAVAATAVPVEPVAQPAVAAKANLATPMRLNTYVARSGESRVYFNDIPGAGRKETPYGKADADGYLTIVAPDGLQPARRAQLVEYVEEQLTALNGGDEVETFARLQELAGVVAAPDGDVVADAGGIVGIAGDTKPNMGVIKAAAAAVGGRANWMGKVGKLQWNVPAKAWDYITENHPEAAKALYKVPA